jgi:hypothetical protein
MTRDRTSCTKANSVDSPSAALSVNYLLATTPPSGVELPFPVPSNLVNDETTYPFGFNGQLIDRTAYHRRRLWRSLREKLTTAVVRAKIKLLAVPLRAHRRRFIHRHAANGVSFQNRFFRSIDLIKRADGEVPKTLHSLLHPPT